ncbi:suppressor of fused domain protein [Clostridium sp. JS66]|uniref:suppressor of fused domain protein n=1 Tax=Clostridium sp. JS66 TaxID=3064705 RepID=UPI00298E78BA|nr:suppressor of fused domain protein [Clostridium sp. JS66]WPC42624.1 suppressor of fused domain protein [Clostridium sp. JS66]
MYGNTLEALKNIVNKSPYNEYLYRNANVIGFNIRNSISDVLMRCGKDQIFYDNIDKNSDVEPELWIEMDADELVEFEKSNKKLNLLRIYTSKKGQVLHPAVETIIARIFMPPEGKKYPFTDLIQLVYGGLTGFQEPRVAWRSKKKDLYVIKYKKVFNDLDLYITCGLTSPNLAPSKLEIEEGKLSGYGYELLMFAKEDDMDLIKQFVAWVNYLDNTGNHIYQGQYLEYGDNYIIEGTNLSGFIILNPIGFPYTIPVTDGYARLNMFVGVTQKELEIAKQTDIYTVADKLFKAGYINYPPKIRESVV